MSIYYRDVQPTEEETLLRFWADILEDTYRNRQEVFGDFVNDRNRFARTQVAVAPDGTICGAVAYWLREIRQTNGKPARVGHLWGMATHPAYRRQGIATALVQWAVAAMQQAGCQWALLFAREEARSLYEQLGWQGFPTRYQGGFVVESSSVDARYQVRAYDPWQEGWHPLANIYAEYNQSRPLSVVRSSAYWQGYVAWMAHDWVEHQCARYLVVTRSPQEICGYTLVHFYNSAYAARHFDSPPWFSISELGVEDSAPGALVALLAGIVQEAQAQQMVYGHLSVPQDPQLEQALQVGFHQPLKQEEVPGSMMTRPIATDVTASQIATLFATPGALLWELDRY